MTLNEAKEKCISIITNKYVLTVGAVLVSSHLIVKSIKKYKRDQRRKAYPKDTVILHQFPAAIKAPTLSPFALKLETWLRMENIKYQNEFTHEYGPKGKTPWITYNGEDVADSHFSMEYLCKKFNLNLYKDLSPAEAGIARAFFKLTEESMLWAMAMIRYVYEPDFETTGLPKLFLTIFKSYILNRGKAQGYGLHSLDEIKSIYKNDLNAIESFIGNKKYLMGDKICYADACLFGALVQFYYNDRKFLYTYMKDNCPNTVRYVEGIKATYWPDWNQRIKDKSASN